MKIIEKYIFWLLASISERANKVSPIYYLSILGSILLSTALGSLFCLIPAHNVLKEPFYWYEYQISIVFGVLPFVIWFVLIQAEYKYNFKVSKL